MIETIRTRIINGEQSSKNNTIMPTRLDTKRKKIKYFLSKHTGLHMIEQGKDEKEDMIMKLCIQ